MKLTFYSVLFVFIVFSILSCVFYENYLISKYGKIVTVNVKDISGCIAYGYTSAYYKRFIKGFYNEKEIDVVIHISQCDSLNVRFVECNYLDEYDVCISCSDSFVKMFYFFNFIVIISFISLFFLYKRW